MIKSSKQIHVLWIVGLALLLVSEASRAAEEGAVMTPERVAQLKSVGSTAMSQDGRFIAYTLSVPRIPGKDEDGTPWTELHVWDLEANLSRPFITGKSNVSSVVWTPDGKGISFLAKRNDDKVTSLYVIPFKGGEASRVLGLKTAISAYSWNPDGSRVAAIAVEPERENRKKLQEKGFKPEVYEEDLRVPKVYIAEIDGEKEPAALNLSGAAFQLAWSPVDDRLLVSLAPTPLVDDRYMSQRVHVVDANSGSVLAKFENPGKLDAIKWSRDGVNIALLSGIDINDPAAGTILVAPASGGDLSSPLENNPGHVAEVVWGPSGTLHLVNGLGVWTSYETVSADGSGRNQLVEPGGPILSSMSLSKDAQKAAFLASSPKHPAELFVFEVGSKAPRRLTNSNPWLANIRLAKQEPVQYKARDGLELEGILCPPLDEQPGQRYPLILSVHGGPEAHRSNGWLTRYSEPGQTAAARGMAVFVPNYRGSTGRGVEFSKLSQGDPAGKEFDDLVDAVDHFIEIGLADREKIGVTGGSYGGYATGWCSTYYSDRFAAGVMFVGISNKVSKVGTTDIPNEEYLVHARKRPWDNWQFFLERSPVYHAEKGQTPLLILHGEDDPRVNVGQSRELYRHLKIHGKAPVRLVLYPGEEHGNRLAAARYDYNLRMLRWFEHYLKGPGGEPPSTELDYKLETAEEE
ncbi:MAG: S9 family peptidase [Acidobacteriota bacterium]|nr:MAG: S9 family peptidase [Acidobacteriota bacterium]